MDAGDMKFFLYCVLWLWTITLLPVFLFWGIDKSRISSPVLEFRPLPTEENSSLIWHKTNDNLSITNLRMQLSEFLDPYNTRKSDNLVNCYSSSMPPPKDKTCDFKIGIPMCPCCPAYCYGYGLLYEGPCVYLTLSKIPKDWTPDFYTSEDLPQEMPQDLKETIRRQEKEISNPVAAVWISCHGETPEDTKNFRPLHFFPYQMPGFEAKYFLNRDVDGYLNPLIALYFERPQRARVITVICTAWAKNIPRETGFGIVRFQLLVDLVKTQNVDKCNNFE